MKYIQTPAHSYVVLRNLLHMKKKKPPRVKMKIDDTLLLQRIK